MLQKYLSVLTLFLTETARTLIFLKFYCRFQLFLIRIRFLILNVCSFVTTSRIFKFCYSETVWVISNTKQFIGKKGIEMSVLCEYVFITMFEVKICKRRRIQVNIPRTEKKIEIEITLGMNIQ